MEKLVFIKGEKINLVIYKNGNVISDCWRWINDREVTKWLARGLQPISFENEETWFNQCNNDKNIVLFIETIDGKPIGSCGLHKIDWQARKAEGGLLIGEKDQWKKGYATESEYLLLDYAFNHLGLNRVQAGIYAENTASLKAAKKNGFKEEGRLRDYFYRHGRYYDIIIVAALKEEWIKSR